MSAKIVTKKEFYDIKYALYADTKIGSKIRRVAKCFHRSAETVRVIGKHYSFASYLHRRDPAGKQLQNVARSFEVARGEQKQESVPWALIVFLILVAVILLLIW